MRSYKPFPITPERRSLSISPRLAAYFQTASRVERYASRWGMEQTLIPRNIFPDLHCPLCFSIFSKDRRRTLVGFALYHEAAAVQKLPERYRRVLSEPGQGSVCRAAGAKPPGGNRSALSGRR